MEAGNRGTKNTPTIPVLEEFLSRYRESLIKFYSEQIRQYREWLYSPEARAINSTRKLQIIRSRFGAVTVRYSGCDEDFMVGDIDKNVNLKRESFIRRIEDEVGEIKEARLRIGIDGEINGVVIGANDSVEVETIGAGGWNVQRFHFRVLVKKINKEDR